MTPQGPGLKYDDGKFPWNLLPPKATYELLEFYRDMGSVSSEYNSDAFVLSDVLVDLLLWRAKGDKEALLRVGGLLIAVTQDGFLPCLREVVRVLQYGAAKYGPNNWQNLDHAKDRYFAAIVRHLDALPDQDVDPESGLKHIHHALCSVLFLLAFEFGDAEARVPSIVEQLAQGAEQNGWRAVPIYHDPFDDPRG